MKLNRILATLTLLVIFSNANALKNDFEQPIYIEADDATFDEKKGESTYTGKVQVTQGSMRLKSDRLVVYTRDQKADKIIATGNPVRFRQTPEKGKKEIKGKSQRAEFYATQSR
ncbi:MAG: lipopolysaccharide transport periplasmic protein LptA, partial [Methylococcales bacterium]